MPVAQRTRLLQNVSGGAHVVATDVRHQAARVVAPVNCHQRKITRRQVLQFGATTGLAQNDAAVRDAQAVAVGEQLVLLGAGIAGQQQQVVVARLRYFFYAEQERREKVGVRDRKRRFAGEHAEHVLEALGHAPRHRVGPVTGFADHVLHPCTRLLRNTRRDVRAVEHQRHRCLPYARQLAMSCCFSCMVPGKVLSSSA